MPSPVYPTNVVTSYINEVDSQPSYEELKREVEEAANLLVDGFDRDSDDEISLSEVIDGVKILILQGSALKIRGHKCESHCLPAK